MVRNISLQIKSRKNRKSKRDLYTGYTKRTYKNGNIYEGNLVNDKRVGFGKIIYSGYKSKYEGSWRNNMVHGKGKFESDKVFYEGEWYYGKYHGKGKLIVKNEHTYDGEFKNGIFDGKGKITYFYPNDNKKYYDTYDGNFKNGKFDGCGELKLSNGDKFNCNWKDGLIHGLGFFDSQETGEYFRGDCENGKKTEGCYKFSNGDKFEGFFENDFPWNGKMEYKNGDIYEGILVTYFNEVLVQQGFGAMLYSNGDYFEGLWMCGHKHKMGVYYYKNGDKYEGEWYMGKKRGHGKYTYKSGKIVEGNFNCDMYEINNNEFYYNKEESNDFIIMTLLKKDYENDLDVHPKIDSLLYPNTDDNKKYSIYYDKKTKERFFQIYILDKLVDVYKIESKLSTENIFIIFENLDNVKCYVYQLSDIERDIIKCPVSLDVMTKPVILSCGHTFDKKSISGLIFSSVQEKQRCPLCRKEIKNYCKNNNIKNILNKCIFSYKNDLIDNNTYYLLKMVKDKDKQINIQKYNQNSWIDDVLDINN